MSSRQLTTEQIARLEAACPSWCESSGAHDWQQDFDRVDFAVSVWEHTRTFGNPITGVTVMAVMDVNGAVARVESQAGGWHGDYDTYDPNVGVVAAARDLEATARDYVAAAEFVAALHA